MSPLMSVVVNEMKKKAQLDGVKAITAGRKVKAVERWAQNHLTHLHPRCKS